MFDPVDPKRNLPMPADHMNAVAAMADVYGDKVKDAFFLADAVHRQQKRKSGEPYVTHPVAVAKMLFDMGADRDTICAALLHDTLEENEHSGGLEDRIHREFGDHVLYMVQALSKDHTIEDKLEQQSKYMQRIQDAFEVDIAVFFIKVADLLHNMSTIVTLSPARKKQWVKELKYQYLPMLSEYFHRVPLAYKEFYNNMMVKVQDVIQSYEENSQKGPE